MCDHLKYRDSVVVSLHPHNDRGCAVADSELGILAGAERIEGTLFGNGERTGNVDIITLALNLYMQGVEPNLDFTNMPEIAELYERVTRMKVYERQPYAGKLVFAAFSGSHPDAIAKGMKWREEKKCAAWTVPYLPIDPEDVGRKYEADVIRINSQSGKGGIGYLLEKNFGYILPAKMREEVGYTVKSVSDRLHSELSANEVLDVFKRTYLNAGGYFSLKNCRFESSPENSAVLTVEVEGKIHQVHGYGCSCLDAVCDAMRKRFKLDFSVLLCEKQPHTKESEKSPVYICIAMKDGRNYWGAGIETDEAGAQENALFSALNRGLKGGT